MKGVELVVVHVVYLLVLRGLHEGLSSYVWIHREERENERRWESGELQEMRLMLRDCRCRGSRAGRDWEVFRDLADKRLKVLSNTIKETVPVHDDFNNQTLLHVGTQSASASLSLSNPVLHHFLIVYWFFAVD